MKPEENPQVHAAVTELHDDAASFFAEVLRANNKPPSTPAQTAEINQLVPSRLLPLFKAWALGEVENTERLQHDARAAYVEIACQVLGLTPMLVPPSNS